MDFKKVDLNDFSLKGIANQCQAVCEVILEALWQAQSEQNMICMDGLCMDKTEVTESSYAAVMGESPSSNGSGMPVTMVSYYNAEDYCKRVGKRLPGSAEWEKFAGSDEFSTHDGKLEDDKGEKEANFASTGPKNVASYLPNRYGMYDMTGNVSEWVAGERGFKDLCGGSWINYYHRNLRVTSYYSGVSPSYHYHFVGFRCASFKPPATE